MKKNINKKLVFNKVSICKLTDREMSDIHGAHYIDTVSWVICCQTATTVIPTGENK